MAVEGMGQKGNDEITAARSSSKLDLFTDP
jgi:hypothetical protein